MQLLQPFIHAVGKPLHIKVLVDLFAAALQALSILWSSFCPAKPGGALCQAFAKPGYSSLVQKKILHAPRLQGGVVPHESPQIIIHKRLFVLGCDDTTVWSIEATAPVSENNSRLRRCGLEPHIQSRAHLRHQLRSAFWSFAGEVFIEHIYMKLGSYCTQRLEDMGPSCGVTEEKSLWQGA